MSIAARRAAQCARIVDLMLLQPSGADLAVALRMLPAEQLAVWLAEALVLAPDGVLAGEVAARLTDAMQKSLDS